MMNLLNSTMLSIKEQHGIFTVFLSYQTLWLNKHNIDDGHRSHCER